MCIRDRPKKGGKVSSDAKEIPERLDTGVEGSNNAQVLPAAHPEGGLHGGKVQQRRYVCSWYSLREGDRYIVRIG